MDVAFIVDEGKAKSFMREGHQYVVRRQVTMDKTAGVHPPDKRSQRSQELPTQF